MVHWPTPAALQCLPLQFHMASPDDEAKQKPYEVVARRLAKHFELPHQVAGPSNMSPFESHLIAVTMNSIYDMIH